MEKKKGIPVSPGISIGEAVVLEDEDLRIGRLFTQRAGVEGEIQRFDAAVRAAGEDLVREIAGLRDEVARSCKATGI